MKLYTNSRSPNGRRANMFIAEKGLEIDKQEIDLGAGENLSDGFKARNPFARVPVLELDDGTHIAESVAISRYLESLQPDPVMFGSTGVEQATIDMWNRRVELNLLIPVAQAFRNLTGFFKDREEICEEWGEISARIAQQVAPLFDQQLAGTKYLAGDKFSVADISLLCTLDFAGTTGQDLLSHSPNVTRWHKLVSARPSAQA